MTQCNIPFSSRPAIFRTDRDKVNYIIGNMGGEDLDWFVPFVENNNPIFGDLRVFETELSRMFERRYALETELVNLKHGSRPVIIYVSHF